MLNSYADLVALLERLKLPIATNPDRSAIEVGTRIRGEPGRMILLWDPRATLLHVIHPLPITLDEARRGPLLEALARVNHALVLPGYGADLDDGGLYFRWVVPRHADGSLTEDEVDRAVRTVLSSVRDFLPALRAVAEGAAASEVLAVAEATRVPAEG